MESEPGLIRLLGPHYAGQLHAAISRTFVLAQGFYINPEGWQATRDRLANELTEEHLRTARRELDALVSRAYSNVQHVATLRDMVTAHLGDDTVVYLPADMPLT